MVHKIKSLNLLSRIQVYYKKGELAESNAQLVARSVRIARELGCEIVSPGETRQMLNIPPLKK